MARNGLAHDTPYLAYGGRYLAFNGNALHRLIWEEHYGSIPEDFCIHHINDDRFDNRIENLKLISRANHCLLHQPRLGFRAPAREICKVCGQRRSQKAINAEPHRYICYKCKAVQNRIRNKEKSLAHL